MKKIQLITTVLATGAVMATPFFALANVDLSNQSNLEVRTNSTEAGVSATTSIKTDEKHAGKDAEKAARVSSTTVMARLDAKSGKEIDARIESLTKLSTRIADLKRLTADEKTTLTGNLNAEIAALTALKAKIAADTDTATLKADTASITKSYRVYMLVMPQAQVTAASDRSLEVIAQMQALSTKLQARITAASTAGVNVTAAQSAYTDMQAKLADASVQSHAAAAAVANLKVDNGDKTIFATNQSAIKDARAKLKIAESDLKSARADVRTILTSVKGKGEVKGEEHASTTVSH